ncbi:N-6 DNA Methylase [Meiothermus luteus]|uniref:site-specific DNA-methyltransferase (adenine-specific) n=1 Tax=Meiothermus luteus TaxID=2026184 RepID=A0A399EPE5_9DEIN|nr:N-6 DNA methylase [Meiothermus luteus]RIH84372.1 N-6 DNA Methylase [Meiothermus luteus]
MLKYVQGRSSEFLLDMAYASAQHIYAHFYSGVRLFDWYTPDRNLVVRMLHRLAGYSLDTINHDIIGHLYSRYVEDEHKHESGMYYTPPEVVEYILDRLGFTGAALIEGKKLLDLACGSGTFLVSAARRVVQAYRDYYRGQIPPDKVQELVETFKSSIYGLDLNPFACYLAETNLLIQVLDLLKIAYAAGQEVHIDRFHIYNTDTLRYAQKTREILARSTSGSLTGFGGAKELPPEEQIKARLGEYEKGFAFVVGNPPYVRADQGQEGLLAYRADLKAHHPIEEVRKVLQQKWDLFVPFVALGHHLLAQGSRMGMITSSAIEAVPYARALSKHLAETAQIDEVAFFQGASLFEDAAVANTIFLLTRKDPTPTHQTLRRWFAGKPGLHSLVRAERRSQVELGERIFRQQIAPTASWRGIPLGCICYISTGMALNADEKTARGAFKKDDLIADTRDDFHPVPYAESKDLGPYALLRLRYLEYGEGLRAPAMIRRPTFPQLYERPKLMIRKIISMDDPSQGQAYLDQGSIEGFLYTHEGVFPALPWHALQGIENKSIGEVPRRKKKERLSAKFALEYLAGVINSRAASDWIRAHRRDPINLYPEDFKALPISRATPARQAPIVEKVRQLQALGLEFFQLRRRGWKLDGKVLGAAHLPAGIARLPLGRARLRWPLRPLEEDVRLNGVWADQGGLYRGSGRRTRKVVESDAPVEALEWLARQFATLDPETTWRMAEAKGVEVPSNPEEARKALEALQAEENAVREKQARFTLLREEVDHLVAELYRR